MKKIATILGIISFLILGICTQNVKAVGNISNTDVMAVENDNEGHVMDIEVRVRVIADGVKIRNNPFPWAKCIQIANKGDNFKYTGHYLGYYLIYVGDEIFYISDNAKSTETYTVPLK